MTDIIPGFWMNETSGVLRPAVEAFAYGDQMTGEQIAAVRAYFRQWIATPGFIGPVVDELRTRIDSLTTVHALRSWCRRAAEEGIDPI